jgi:hypothetical protein
MSVRVTLPVMARQFVCVVRLQVPSWSSWRNMRSCKYGRCVP